MEKENCDCRDCKDGENCQDCKKCNNKPTSMDKWRYSFYTLLIFIIVVNPMTYKLVNGLLISIFGKLADGKGCPTMMGLVIHSIVFLLLVRYVMDLDI